jgi:hypothetical protein
MDYTDVVADMGHLDDAYMAPEEAQSRAADAWMSAFGASGLTSLAGELDKAHQDGPGRVILGWIVGEDEYYYYVVYDMNQRKVFTEKRRKAARN